MKKPWLRRGAAFLLLGVAVFSAWKLASYWGASNRAEADFASLSAKVHAAASGPLPKRDPHTATVIAQATPSQPVAETASASELAHAVVRPENLAELREENGDLFGWVSVDGTKIDYPVMHTPEHPEYYLRRDFTGNYSLGGTPFLDGRCSADSNQLILWGHNMYTGTMFANLTRYRDADFAARHGTVVLTTPEGAANYQIIASFDSVPGGFPWYDALRFEREADFRSFIDGLAENADYPLLAMPEYGGRFLTLATCSGKGDGRLVVVAYQPPQ